MDKFAKESIEFENVVCAAPSSAMSLSAMFSSIPAYYLSKTFKEFKYKNNDIETLIQCPTCHTFISKSEAIISNAKYYCSKECLNQKN